MQSGESIFPPESSPSFEMTRTNKERRWVIDEVARGLLMERLNNRAGGERLLTFTRFT
jgi:hypothetical protein